MNRSSEVPRFLQAYIEDHHSSAPMMREKIKDRLRYYRRLTRPATDEIGFIAKVMKCSRSSAKKVVEWAEGAKADGG